jgi:LysR family hydrogen peroxide-inducible transcriptional activator
MLAVKPPVPVSDNLALLRFATRAPSRRIALAWRKTSAMAAFLQQLAALIGDLPADLLAEVTEPAAVGPTRVARRRRA